MNLHSSAKTCPYSRALLVLRVRRDRWPVQRAASSANISLRTAYKWLARFRAHGVAGLQDRSSRPRSPSRTKAAVVAQVIGLRRQRLPATVVAQMLGQPRSTGGLILRRKGLARWSSLQKKVPAVRYELAERRPAASGYQEAGQDPGRWPSDPRQPQHPAAWNWLRNRPCLH